MVCVSTKMYFCFKFCCLANFAPKAFSQYFIPYKAVFFSFYQYKKRTSFFLVRYALLC